MLDFVDIDCALVGLFCVDFIVPLSGFIVMMLDWSFLLLV